MALSPAAHLNSTTEHVGLVDAAGPLSGLTGVVETQPVAQQITGLKENSTWQTSEQDEVGSPPAVSLDSAPEGVGLLDATVPPSSLTGVGRQAPWSGVALASPPWTVCMPAANSPVTTLTRLRWDSRARCRVVDNW